MKLLLNMLLTERQSEGGLRGGNGGEEAERGDIKRMETMKRENSKWRGINEWRLGREDGGRCMCLGGRKGHEQSYMQRLGTYAETKEEGDWR